MNHPVAAIIVISLYLLGTVVLLLRSRDAEMLRAAPKFVLLLPGLLALLLHAWILQDEMLTPTGINLGFYNALSLIAACITLFTLVSTLRYQADLMLMVIMPVTAIAVALDATSTSSHLLAPGSSSALITHVLTSLIAYSVLGLSALHAVLLSIQNSFLHDHHPGGIIKILPPLKAMETILFEGITVGFILLTISLGTGLMFLENMFAQQLAHKTVLSIIAWVVFSILLIGRLVFGWRGKTATRWTLGGFVSLMLAYFGSKFVLEILLA